MTDIAQRDPARELVAQVRSPQFKEQVAMLLGDDTAAERFVRVGVTALQTNPDIATCEHASIFQALLMCAADGLLPNGRQAAIVKRKSKASYMPMIGGLYDRAMEYGWTLKAKAVYAADEFDYTDEPETITHRQARPNVDRGELVAAYAVATHRNGARRQAILFPEDIAKRRAKATTQAVWNEWPAQMWEKSVAHDLYDQLGFAESAKATPLARVEDIADPVAALYGPRHDRALPASEDPTEEPLGQAHPAASRTPDVLGASERASSSGDDQRAGPAAHTPPGAAGPAPGPEPSPPDFAPPAEALDDPAVVEANAAAGLVVPIGQWKGRTLAEVLDAGDKGASWLAYALKNFDDSTGTGPNSEPRLGPGEFVEALRAFARIYAPEQHQQALAEKEAVA